MKSEIVTIGTELILGLSMDTNGPYIARKLAEKGIQCGRIISLPDDADIISKAIGESLRRCDLLVITGGLGPTVDDVTREAVSEALNQELVYDDLLAEMLKQKFSGLEITPPDIVYRQAYRPAGARAIKPIQGTAPGLVIDSAKKTIMVFPGVPREMGEMLEGQLTEIEKRLKARSTLRTRIIKASGASEAVVAQKVEDLMENSTNPTMGILGYAGEVHLLLTGEGKDASEAEAYIEPVQEEIRERLGNLVFGQDLETLEGVVGQLLDRYGLKLAVAESCSAGLVAERITNIPGSSGYFVGGVIAYSNSLKRDLLKVSPQVLLEHGAVSAVTAEAMAAGVRAITGAEVGLAVTGIAGPSGATPEKPVGLTFIGIASSPRGLCERFILTGDRQAIRQKAAQTALNLLRLFLLDNFEPEDSVS